MTQHQQVLVFARQVALDAAREFFSPVTTAPTFSTPAWLRRTLGHSSLRPRVLDIVRPVAFAAALAATHQLVAKGDVATTLLLNFSVMILALGVVVFSVPALLAIVFVRRSAFVSALGLTTATAAGLVFWFTGFGADQLPADMLISALLQGLLLGILMRALVEMRLSRTVTGELSRYVEWLQLLGIGMFVALFPFGVSGVPYVVGVSIGMTLRNFVTMFEKRHARRVRERMLLQTLSRQRHWSLSARETSAIELFIRRRSQRLNCVEPGSNAPSTVLAIINALQERGKGNFEAALSIADSQLRNPHADKAFEPFLRLILALSRLDVGDTRDSIMRDLAAIPDSSPERAWADLLQADLRADEVSPFDRSLRSRQEAEATLKFVTRSIRQLEETSADEPLSALVELQLSDSGSVPVASVTIAHLWLKTGQLHLAKAMLSSSIRSNPRYSRAYLHLAECYVVESSHAQAIERRATSLRLADFCLSICLALEPRQSATSRSAMTLRKWIDGNEGNSAVPWEAVHQSAER